MRPSEKANDNSSGFEIITQYKRAMIEPSPPWLPKAPKPQRSGLFLMIITAGGLMISILCQTVY